MSTVKATNFSHPSAANPAIVLDAAGGATVAGMGLVLVSPTSIANSGGSASASGGQVTFTGVSSVSLNGVFTSAYEFYRIVCSYTASSNAQNLNFRFRVSGTDNSANEYYSALWRARYDGSSQILNTITTIGAVNVSGTARNSLSMDVIDPFLASFTSINGVVNGVDGTQRFVAMNGMQHTVSSSFDGFSLIPASGNITGTIRVYGYKNS